MLSGNTRKQWPSHWVVSAGLYILSPDNHTKSLRYVSFVFGGILWVGGSVKISPTLSSKRDVQLTPWKHLYLWVPWLLHSLSCKTALKPGPIGFFLQPADNCIPKKHLDLLHPCPRGCFWALSSSVSENHTSLLPLQPLYTLYPVTEWRLPSM